MQTGSQPHFVDWRHLAPFAAFAVIYPVLAINIVAAGTYHPLLAGLFAPILVFFLFPVTITDSYLVSFVMFSVWLVILVMLRRRFPTRPFDHAHAAAVVGLAMFIGMKIAVFLGISAFIPEAVDLKAPLMNVSAFTWIAVWIVCRLLRPQRGSRTLVTIFLGIGLLTWIVQGLTLALVHPPLNCKLLNRVSERTQYRCDFLNDSTLEPALFVAERGSLIMYFIAYE